MSDDRDTRRALLISGAITGELTPSERVELDALRDADPTVDREIGELSEVLRLTTTSVAGWDSSAPSDELRARIFAQAQAEEQSQSQEQSPSQNANVPIAPAHVVPLRRPWRVALVALGAAACIAVGAGGVLLIQPPVPSTPTGPPGTLGALEEIAFTGEPTGVTIDGSLVAHTWGTETILNITGLTEANPYDVVLVTVDGESLDSGSFLGSSVAIDCEMNAAVMRESVSSVEIQDASGAVVASAQLPAAS